MSWCLGLGASSWLLMAGTFVVLAAAIWAIARLFPAAPAPDPAAVLDARLAAGDLDLGTYQALRGALAGAVPAAGEGSNR